MTLDDFKWWLWAASVLLYLHSTWGPFDAAVMEGYRLARAAPIAPSTCVLTLALASVR